MMNPERQATNSDIAGQLALMGRLLEVAGEDGYRAAAYARAARQVERVSLPVTGLDEEALTRIPGIGVRIAGQIREIAETGSFRELKDLQAAVPGSVIDLLDIDGVGPRTAHVLWKRLGILTVDDLERAVRGKRLRAARGFGAKREEVIGRGIRRYRERSDLLTRPEADAVLGSVAVLFPEGGYTVAGGYRRGTSTVDRIEIVATGGRDELIHRIPADAVAGEDEGGISFSLHGARVDVRFTDRARHGTALLCATGSPKFLARLSEVALAQGRRLEPGGLVDPVSGRIQTFGSEEEVFAFLDMETVPPELREGWGEVELALSRSLPDLVECSDLRGDLHLHTTASDGHQSLEDVAAAGDARGYEYIAITDHSSRVRPEGLERQRAGIERVNRRHTCQLLAGSEVDIRSDGSLGYPDRVLADLDLVIASVHSGFGQNQDVLTRRVLSAMENEHVDIIGHPTGRLLGRRPPYAIDLDRVIDHAAATGTALEINASPHRLDLEDIYIRRAKERGVRLAVGTDAHRVGEFSNICYGIMLARRGWCTRGDLVNTLTLSELLEWLS
ncbi:MAG: DNA polymerase/3'-5' exonuclease PolX [Methanomicrobiales archaeon]|nr:DNA polymerase/3'-5' exonuclease PolX [Methanomicrobiales archaeon]